MKVFTSFSAISLGMTTTTAANVYGATLAPSTAALAARPGSTVTYTLWLTNTGNITNTFDLALSGNTWPTQLSTSHVTLAAGAGTSLTVRVTLPLGAPNGAQDTAGVTATGTQVTRSSSLTTTVRGYAVLMPVVARNLP